MNFSAADHLHMASALRLAENGLQTTHPNPRVGCVIAQQDAVVGQGWHRCAGEPHAEILALREAGRSARGATAYVTLEPCCHHGRTGPCTEALIDAGIARVVAAMPDPFDQVAGLGLERLRAAGIVVDTGLMAEKARWLNRGFISRCERQRPWVRLKLAVGIDGRTALQNGASQWISGAAARQDVQNWRARASAVMTGIGTLLADRPRLNVRLDGVERQPDRIVVDSHWQSPADAPILVPPGRVMIAGLEHAPVPEPLAAAGCELIPLPAVDSKPSLAALFGVLAQRGINELQVECGARLAGALMRQRYVDELLLYMAPRAMGDPAKGMFDIGPLTAMTETAGFGWHDIRKIGGDLRLRLLPKQVS